jgi:hypothetical protein
LRFKNQNLEITLKATLLFNSQLLTSLALTSAIYSDPNFGSINKLEQPMVVNVVATNNVEIDFFIITRSLSQVNIDYTSLYEWLNM